MEGAYQLGWHPRPEQMMAVSGQEDSANIAGNQRSKTADVRASVRENPSGCATTAREMQKSKPVKHGLY